MGMVWHMKELFASVMLAAAEYIFISLPWVLVVSLIFVWRTIKIRAIQKKLSPVRGHALLGASPLWRLLAKAFLVIIGALLLGISLLRPQWHKREEMVHQQGRDLLIAVDVSRSMLAQDCLPNRLAVTKHKIRSLVDRLSCERVGLLLFSGMACVQCPLTADRAAFFMFLDALDVETISSGTTAIDEAIKKALEVFQQVPSRKHKMLVLFTDGEDFSTDLSQVKRDAQQVGMMIFTIGLGTSEGAPIPLFDQRGNTMGHQKDKKGSVVISRLNEAMLRSLAQESGGFYVPVSCSDDHDMRYLVQKIGEVEKESLEEVRLTQLEEQYHYFLIGSFMCFVLEWLL
jgi:Ca-activated chloride channel homolog